MGCGIAFVGFKMNIGFKLFYQSDLSPDDLEISKKYLDKFYTSTVSDPKNRYFGIVGGGRDSGLWRNRLGLTISDEPKLIVFRRISKNLRHFAAVYAETMEIFNHKPLDKYDYNDKVIPNGPIKIGCQCPRHRGALKVRFIKKPDFVLYKEFGSDRG